MGLVLREDLLLVDQKHRRESSLTLIPRQAFKADSCAERNAAPTMGNLCSGVTKNLNLQGEALASLVLPRQQMKDRPVAIFFFAFLAHRMLHLQKLLLALADESLAMCLSSGPLTPCIHRICRPHII